MWGDSWVNLVMKMKDMPYFSYGKDKKEKVVEGTVDILKAKFSKYIEK